MTFSNEGDQGYTSLLGGQRVLKCGPQPEICGTLDEASSALGLARAACRRGRTAELILSIQKDLHLLGAELATAPEDRERYPYRITADHIRGLETLLQKIERDVSPPRRFIFPGDTFAAAAIDLGRTIIRRAERRAVQMTQERMIASSQVLPFLNRLSDLLFTLARYEEGAKLPCTGSPAE